MLYGIRYMRIDETFFFQQTSAISSAGVPAAPARRRRTALTPPRPTSCWAGRSASWAPIASATAGGWSWTSGPRWPATTRRWTFATRATWRACPATFEFRERENCLAVIGETNFMTMYQLTHNLSMRAGYQMIWVDGVTIGFGELQSEPGRADARPRAIEPQRHARLSRPPRGLHPHLVAVWRVCTSHAMDDDGLHLRHLLRWRTCGPSLPKPLSFRPP